MSVVFNSVPANAMIVVESDKRLAYIEAFSLLPLSIQRLLMSEATGAYIRGLTKVYNLPLEQASAISLIILEVFIGYKELAKLGVVFSSQLGTPNDVAQTLAHDVEKELFAPVMMDFNQFLTTRKQQPKQMPGGAQNVINLKNPLRDKTQGNF